MSILQQNNKCYKYSEENSVLGEVSYCYLFNFNFNLIVTHMGGVGVGYHFASVRPIYM